MDTLQDEARWQAVMTKDKTQDGHFLLGVLTTGVFCKPSCGARLPLRKNVRFYDSAAAAMADHLRPCLRCQPLTLTKDHPQRGLMKQLCRYIREHSEDALTLEQLATQAHLSPQHLQRVFQTVIGVTPKAYADACRLQRLRKGLRTETSVTAAIHHAGYGSSSRIYEKLDTHLGMTPKQYRQGGAQVAISYAIMATPLGWMVVGATDRGLCCLQFAPTPEALLPQLQAEFPNATLTETTATQSEQFGAWMQALTAYLSGFQEKFLDLPIDVSGTAFQYKVWQYLQHIPQGEVQSYTEVAQGIGQPKAVRAVANACGANRVAIVIPCHRVIRGDGSLGGYRWGLERKRTLLDGERRAVHGS
jgi:AraC family transcriptional regulator, regulatory protein of adaptative response / methylated-DNA-[protein]-cysteine methyltransferase